MSAGVAMMLGAAATLLVTAAAAVSDPASRLPGAMTVDGKRLELVSCGVRDTLWIDHYVAGLYVPPGTSPLAVKNPRQAKAVRLQVLEERLLPQHIPAKWRGALEAELAREPMLQVRRAYRSIAAGDVIAFVYTPGTGVAMTVNGRVVTRSPDHAVIDAILEAWSEADPIAGRLNRLVLENPC